MSMGLDDISPETTVSESQHKDRAYPPHEYEERLWEWVDGLQDRFPEEVQIDFIEVSDRMTQAQAKGYCKERGTVLYIRIAERVIENEDDEYIKTILLHEMVHLWFYQNSWFDVGDSDPIFNWVLGAVGADLSGSGQGDWQHTIMEKFR